MHILYIKSHFRSFLKMNVEFLYKDHSILRPVAYKEHQFSISNNDLQCYI